MRLDKFSTAEHEIWLIIFYSPVCGKQANKKILIINQMQERKQITNGKNHCNELLQLFCLEFRHKFRMQLYSNCDVRQYCNFN